MKKTIERVLPDPCVCQKTPSFAAAVLACRLGRAQLVGLPAIEPGVVHTEVLVVPRDELDEPAGQLLEDGEVLDDVEEALRRAHPADHRLERDAAFLALGVDPLPLDEVLPAAT